LKIIPETRKFHAGSMPVLRATTPEIGKSIQEGCQIKNYTKKVIMTLLSYSVSVSKNHINYSFYRL